MTDLGFLGPKAYKARPPLDAFRDGLLVVGSIDSLEKASTMYQTSQSRTKGFASTTQEGLYPRLQASPKSQPPKNMLPMLSDQFSKNSKPKELSSRTNSSGFKRPKFGSIITA